MRRALVVRSARVRDITSCGCASALGPLPGELGKLAGAAWASMEGAAEHLGFQMLVIPAALAPSPPVFTMRIAAR